MNLISIFLFIVIGLEFLLLFYYLFNKNINMQNRILILTYVFIISIMLLFIKTNYVNIYFLLAVLTCAVLKLIFNNYELEKRYSKIIKCVIDYEKIIDEQGKNNHEYNNQLMILKGYINNKKKLNEYLDLIIEDHKLGQNYEIRQLSNFPNDGLKEMLYYKITKIKDNNIKYFLNVSSNISELLEKLNPNKYKEITKVFGVLIDNAIDGAIVSKEKEVNIDFSRDNEYIIIMISNSYDRNVDLMKIGKKGFSSKGKGHGFGLKLVKEIIKKNKNLELITDCDDKYFNQTFLIDTKK